MLHYITIPKFLGCLEVEISHLKAEKEELEKTSVVYIYFFCPMYYKNLIIFPSLSLHKYFLCIFNSRT